MTAGAAADVERELAALAELDRTALLERWRKAFGRDAPPRLSRALMEKAIAYEVQVKRLRRAVRAHKTQLEGRGQGRRQLGIEQAAQPRDAVGS